MRFLSTCVVLLALDACVLTPSTGYGRACDVDADCDDGDACDVARGFCVPGDAVEGEGEGEGDVGEGEGEGEGEGDEGEGEGDVGEGEGEVDFFRVQPLPPQVVDEDAELVVAVTVDNPPAGSLVQLAASSANGALVSVDENNQLHYQARSNINGADVVTISAVAGEERAVDASVAINVVAVDDAPSFTPRSLPLSLREDEPGNAIVAESGVAGPADEADDEFFYDVVVTAGADLIAAAAVDPATGRLAVVPARDRNGAATLRVTIVDAGGAGTSSDVNVVIAPINDPPRLVSPAGPFFLRSDVQDVVVVIGTISPGPFEDGQTINLIDTEDDDPANLFARAGSSAALTGGVLALRVRLNAGSAPGSFGVRFNVRDGGGGGFGGNNVSAEIDVGFTVVGPSNDPALLSPLRIATTPQRPQTLPLVVEEDGNQEVTVSVVDQPANGTLSVTGSGASAALVFVPSSAGASTGTAQLQLGGNVNVDVATVVVGPQPSCFHLRARGAAAGDGVYALNGFDAYCDMTSDGGGWTLVAKIDGDDDEFDFDDARWTDDTVLAEDSDAADLVVGANDGRDGEAKLRSFSSVKVDSVRIGMARRDSGSRAFSFVAPDFVLRGPTAQSLSALVGGLPQFTAAPDIAAWRSLDGEFAVLNDSCQRGGTNRRTRSRAVRIGVAADDDGCLADRGDFVGVGGNSGNVAAGVQHLDQRVSRVAAVLVRSFDLGDVGGFANCSAVRAAGFDDNDAVFVVDGEPKTCPR